MYLRTFNPAAWILLPMLLVALAASHSIAQIQFSEGTEGTEKSANGSFASQFDVPTELQQKFDKQFREWRNTVRELQAVGVQYFNATSMEEAEQIRETYDKLVAQGNQQMEQFLPTAIELFKKNGTNAWKTDDQQPSPQRDLDHLITQIQDFLFDKGRFDQAFELGEALLKNNKENQPADFVKRRAAVLTNRFFDVGNIGVDFEDEMESIPEAEKLLYRILPNMAQAFDVELEKRKADEQANDLPRVQMKTTKGTVVFELFEDQAPDTVGNFIHLVETGFYEGLIFHRVIDRFMVQGGAIDAKGNPKPVGYKIYDEHNKKDLRLHFRGSLSMAKTTAEHSASSQFFVCLVPTPGLNGKHTCFGRVLSGMDVFDRINRTEKENEEGESEPIRNVVHDKIISAKVLRKRDHKYEPNRVQ